MKPKSFTLATALILFLAIFAIGGEPRHVLLFIGDGMGEMQVEAAELAKAKGSGEKLSFREFPVLGWQRTASANAKITDSAAAITAIACGVRTNNGMLGITPDGRPLESIAVIAHKAGWRIGILSSVSLDHATPAGFYANDKSRGNMSAISRQLADSPFEFFGGGGLMGQKADDSSEDNLQRAIRNGFKVLRTRDALAGARKDERILAMNHRLSGGASLPWALDQKDDDVRLSEFTAAAIRRLEGAPFFMMVEGGKIDWACHSNDLTAAVGDTIEFDAAVRLGFEFYKKNPDNTLVIVTADHETGGLKKLDKGNPSAVFSTKMTSETLSSLLKKMQSENADFAKVIALVKDEFGLGSITAEEESRLSKAWIDSLSGAETKSLYGRESPVVSVANCIIAERAGFKFTSTDHTGVDVPVYAIGAGSENFAGSYDNTEIFAKLRDLMKLSVASMQASR